MVLYLPSDARIGIEVGMAWASAIAFTGAGLLALTVPQLIQALGPTKLLGLFAYVSLISFSTLILSLEMSANFLGDLMRSLFCVFGFLYQARNSKLQRWKR